MEIKTIKTNITAVDKIFHISDIHIRTLKRHKEYQEVFDNLFLHIAQHAILPFVLSITFLIL